MNAIEISELLQNYFNYLSFSKSSCTVENYKYKLLYFFKFVNKIEIDKQDVFFIFSKITTEGKGAVCVNLMYSALKSFYKYLNDFNIYKIDVSTFEVERQKYVQKKQKYSTYSEAKDILSRLKTDTFSERRNKLSIELLSTTGIRLSELVNIKIKDFDFQDKTLTILKTKNKTPRVIPIPNSLINNILIYLKERETIAKTDFFLIKETGEHIQRGLFYYIFKKIEKTTGIKTTAHAFRRGLATDLYNNDVELEHIADMLGHKNINVTRNVYIYGNGDKLKEAVSVHPAFKKETVLIQEENKNYSEEANMLTLYKTLELLQRETQNILNQITLLSKKTV